MAIRKAKLTDVPHIHRLVNHYAGERIMLPRTLTDIYENVWEFSVMAEDDGRLVGCGALKLYNQEVAEIRSLCVDETLNVQRRWTRNHGRASGRSGSVWPEDRLRSYRCAHVF